MRTRRINNGIDREMPRPDTITNKTTKLIAVNIINNDAQKVSI